MKITLIKICLEHAYVIGMEARGRGKAEMVMEVQEQVMGETAMVASGKETEVMAWGDLGLGTLRMHIMDADIIFLILFANPIFYARLHVRTWRLSIEISSGTHIENGT